MNIVEREYSDKRAVWTTARIDRIHREAPQAGQKYQAPRDNNSHCWR